MFQYTVTADLLGSYVVRPHLLPSLFVNEIVFVS